MEHAKSTANSPENKKTKRIPIKLSKKLLLITLLVFIALASLTYALLSWRQNKDLKADIAENNAKLQSLNEEVKSLKQEQAQTTSKEPAKEETEDYQKVLTNIKVGQAVDTESGKLLVKSHEKTSLHDIASSYNSIEQTILMLRVTISNTSNTTQTYYAGQFTFVDSDKVQKNTAFKGTFLSVGFKDFLDTLTLEPGGSVNTNIFFDNYY